MGRADRLNRFLVFVVGLLLTAAGAAGLVASFGGFGAGARTRRLSNFGFSQYVARHPGRFWPGIAVIAVILGLLALYWLYLQFASPRVGSVELQRDQSGGRTELSTSAVIRAVENELRSYRGVTGARARFVGDDADPTMVLGVTTNERVEVAELRQRIETEAIAHARTATDRPDLPVRLDLSVSASEERRTA